MLRHLSLITGMALAAGHVANAQPVRAPCCRVVASNTRTGVALARTASGKTFLFISKDRLLTGLRIGTAVNFSRTGGVTVPGSTGKFQLIKPPKSGGGYSVDVDCSLAPEMCPGSKPAAKLTMNGVTTWDDVIDFCNDEIDACVDGPA